MANFSSESPRSKPAFDQDSISFNNNPLMFNWKKEFKYDEVGLTDIQYYKDDHLEYKRKITYNSEGLIELDLKRNESNKKMTILQFKYFK